MNEKKDKVFEYLIVDQFMQGLMESRALATAFDMGIIDYLIQSCELEKREIKKKSGGKGPAFDLLIDLLKINGIIEKSQSGLKLTGKFLAALPFRDIMLARLRFANLVTPDFTSLFTTLVSEPENFYRVSRAVDLFGYNLCYDYNQDNYERAEYWVKITTVFTKYEAPVCLSFHDFSGYSRIMDIGGNSGEFVLAACRRNPDISATVFDLPLVCDIGRKHVEQEPESSRITFEKGNAFKDPLPDGFDLVMFKSMLHDWPDEAALDLITRAADSLVPGGRLLIFERGPIELKNAVPPYSILPFILFSQSFRPPTLYEAHLGKSGFKDISVKKIDLETPFFLITATKT